MGRCVINVHLTVTRMSRFQCLIGVINKPTTVELCISPVYRRLAVAKVHRVEIAHVTLTTHTQETLTHHKTKTSHGRPVYTI